MIKEKSMNKGKALIGIGVILIIISLIITTYNKYEELLALETAQNTLNVLKEDIVSQEHNLVPLISNNEVKEMKTINVEGNDYIGTLTIPTIDLELPVMSEYSNSRLKKAPCRYYGNIFTNDLIICAHAYKTFFGDLSKLNQKDLIIFTDIEGNKYIYEVLEIEILKPTDVDKMINNDFDLTLYTCTYDNSARVTVRCNRINM